MTVTLDDHAPRSRLYLRANVIAPIGLLLLAGLIFARLSLNAWLLDYVNDVLNNIKGYQGSVERIDIDLYRGAYRIYDLKLMKKNGAIPVPFVDIETADLSVQWAALLDGRVVADTDLVKPVINFAISKSGNSEQTGQEVDWTRPIRDLMPLDINHVTFRQGKLSYQDFSTTPKVNVYINNMNGEVRNLRNVEDKNQRLPSTLVVNGNSIGGGKLAIKGKMNILRRIPDLDLDTKIENIHLPALSDYTNAYAAIDIREGNLNVYSELIVKNDHVSGYIKPIATNVGIIDLRKTTNPIKLLWEAAVSVVVEIFTNHAKDQFATKIQLEGDLSNIETDTWSTIGGIIRNAFIQSFKRGFDTDVDFKSAPGK